MVDPQTQSDRDDHQEQIELNYEVFLRELPTLLPKHRGKFALMQNRELIAFFDTAHDAYAEGKRLFRDGCTFSVQEIIELPINLGFFSHVLP